MAKKLFKSTILSVLLCVSYSSNSYTEDDFCIKETSCLCELDDERYIDISRVITKDKPYLSVRAESQNLTYYFSPCQDFKFDYKKLNLPNNTVDAACAEGSSLCLYNATGQSLINLGTTKDTKFSSSVPKLLVYTRKKPNVTTQSIIKLVCTPEELVPYLELDSVGNFEDRHQLVLFSSHACVRTDPHGLSTGSSLLVLFTVGVGVYLLVGALVLHFLRGARGKETIPNLDFWVDLPYLVRDGFIFLLNGCNPLSVSTAETYDRI